MRRHSSPDDPLRLALHVGDFATDESLVRFHNATQLGERSRLHRKANPMQHEPSGLLCDLQTAMHFIRADTVFATGDQPHCREPLLKLDRGIFKNCPGLQRELYVVVFAVALPDAFFGDPKHFLGLAARTLHLATRPAQFHHEITAMVEVIEPHDSFAETVWRLLWRLHVSSMPENA